MANREVRLQPIPKRFEGKRWEMEDRPVVLVDSNAWVMVRRADLPMAMPYVVSRKEWNKFAAQGIAAGTDETLKAAQPEGQEPGPKDAPGPCSCLPGCGR